MMSTRSMTALGRLALCMMAACLAGCACRKVTPVYTDPQQIIMVSPGQRFEIRLPADRAAGLEWQIPYMNAGNLVVIGERYPESVRPGPAGEQAWTFRAVGQGDTFVPLTYVKVFEPGRPAEKSAVFKVSIH